jgi:hypothetical protein
MDSEENFPWEFTYYLSVEPLSSTAVTSELQRVLLVPASVSEEPATYTFRALPPCRRRQQVPNKHSQLPMKLHTGDKAAITWKWSHAFIYFWHYTCMELYLHFLTWLYHVVPNITQGQIHLTFTSWKSQISQIDLMCLLIRCTCKHMDMLCHIHIWNWQTRKDTWCTEDLRPKWHSLQHKPK